MDDQPSYEGNRQPVMTQHVNPIFGFSHLPNQVQRHYVNSGRLMTVKGIYFCEADDDRHRGRLEITCTDIEDIWEWSLLPEEDWFQSNSHPGKTNKMAWRLIEQCELDEDS